MALRPFQSFYTYFISDGSMVAAVTPPSKQAAPASTTRAVKHSFDVLTAKLRIFLIFGVKTDTGAGGISVKIPRSLFLYFLP